MYTPLVITSIQQGLTTSRLGRRILLYDEIDSTSTVAMTLAKEGGEEGTLILAEAQTKGRGRMGRTWYSPKGLNLYLSLILRPSCTVPEVPWLGMAAAVAMAKTIEQHSGLPARVKWPNDIQLSKQKVAGLLLEQAVQGERVASLILGIGINLNMEEKDLPAELASTVTSLKIQLGRRVDRIRFLQELLATLEAWYGIFLQASYEEIRRNYLGLFELLGQPVRIQEREGRLTGTVAGLTSEGALLLRLPNGEETSVHTGELFQMRMDEDVADH